MHTEIKVIIYKSRGESSFWNIIWHLGWSSGGWQYWKFWKVCMLLLRDKSLWNIHTLSNLQCIVISSHIKHFLYDCSHLKFLKNRQFPLHIHATEILSNFVQSKNNVKQKNSPFPEREKQKLPRSFVKVPRT